jgi:Cdc6-like AAA superfamily ATPase
MVLAVKTWVPLQPSFVPPVLIARDEKFAEILNGLTSPVPRNLYVSGPKGLGKSVTVNCVMNELLARYRDIVPVHIPLSRSLNTTWAKVCSGAPRRMRGAPWVLKLIGKNRGVVVFDDISALYRRSDLMRVIRDLHEGTTGNISIVLVSTQSLYTFERECLSSEVGEGVKSRCSFYPIVFRPYTKDEVAAIIRQRLEFATGGAGGWSEEALDFIASKVERHGSDMRLGIRLLLIAAELAYNRRADLTLEIAQEAWQREKEDYWMKEYMELHPHKAFLLYQVFRCMKGKEYIYSREAYDAYIKSCVSLNVKPMTGRQLFNYLQDLEHERFINLTVEFTPQGKLTKITSDLQPEMMVSAGDRVNWEELLR